MRLRCYQREAVAAIRGRLNAHRSALAVMATGLGKTVCFAHIAHEWRRGRVLVMAHRDELIRQAAEKIQAVTGEAPAIEMGEERSDEGAMWGRARCVITSVQTMSRPNRLARFNPQDFGLLVVDEAHHATAASYRTVINHFARNPAFRWLGVTATPRRADEAALGQVFDSVACDYGIEWAVQEGWLVPVRQRVVVVDGLDFSKVRTVAGDFHQGELEELLAQESPLHAMAAPTVDIAAGRPTLVFCVGVKHAQMVAGVLNRYRPNSAEWVCGDKSLTPAEKRQKAVSDFKQGRLQFLCNVGVFLEGFDAPNTALVVMGRPTKSLSLYTQVLGRGTRPLPGVVDPYAEEAAAARKAAIAASAKPFATVLDFVGNHQQHARNAAVTAADVLGGRYGDPVRQYAKRTAQAEGGAADVEAALDRAEAELALLAEEAERRRLITARANYRVADFDHVGGRPAREFDREQRGEPATGRQVWKLTQLGVSRETAKRYTKRQASAVISKLLEGAA